MNNKNDLSLYLRNLLDVYVRVNVDNHTYIRPGTVASVIDYSADRVYLKGYGDLKITSKDDITDMRGMPSNTINLGDTCTLKRSYNSKRAGDAIVIRGFLDEAKSKIITDDLTPGGWIDIQHVQPTIDYTNLRYKTVKELLRDFGPDFYKIAVYKANYTSFEGKSIAKGSIVVRSDQKYQDVKQSLTFYPSILTNDPIVDFEIGIYIRPAGEIMPLNQNQFSDGGTYIANLIKHSGEKIDKYMARATGASTLYNISRHLCDSRSLLVQEDKGDVLIIRPEYLYCK